MPVVELCHCASISRFILSTWRTVVLLDKLILSGLFYGKIVSITPSINCFVNLLTENSLLFLAMSCDSRKLAEVAASCNLFWDGKTLFSFQIQHRHLTSLIIAYKNKFSQYPSRELVFTLQPWVRTECHRKLGTQLSVMRSYSSRSLLHILCSLYEYTVRCFLALISQDN
jgi:hypothetical protein